MARVWLWVSYILNCWISFSYFIYSLLLLFLLFIIYYLYYYYLFIYLIIIIIKLTILFPIFCYHLYNFFYIIAQPLRRPGSLCLDSRLIMRAMCCDTFRGAFVYIYI